MMAVSGQHGKPTSLISLLREGLSYGTSTSTPSLQMETAQVQAVNLTLSTSAMFVTLLPSPTQLTKYPGNSLRPTQPANCEIGDLSGKFDRITASPFSLSFDDLFISTDPTNVAFIGGRSLTIHVADKTRIACASFVVEVNDGDDSSDTDDDSGDTEDNSTDNTTDEGSEKRATSSLTSVIPAPTTTGSANAASPTTTHIHARPTQTSTDDGDDGDDEVRFLLILIHMFFFCLRSHNLGARRKASRVLSSLKINIKNNDTNLIVGRR